MSRFRRILEVVVFVVLVLSLAACSGIAASQAKKVVVAVASEEKPLAYTENGKLVGYEVRIR